MTEQGAVVLSTGNAAILIASFRVCMCVAEKYSKDMHAERLANDAAFGTALTQNHL